MNYTISTAGQRTEENEILPEIFVKTNKQGGSTFSSWKPFSPWPSVAILTNLGHLYDTVLLWKFQNISIHSHDYRAHE